MYYITADGTHMHVPGAEERQIVNPMLSEKLDQIDSFTFDIHPNHPMYDALVQMRTQIRIYQDHDPIWEGRVIDNDDESDKTRSIVCEGEMGYLIDSIQQPYDEDFVLIEFLEFLIDNHNRQVDGWKQFKLGNVYVEEEDDADTARTSNDYQTTKAALDNVRTKYGGHFVVRKSDGVRYLDYIKEYTHVSTQPITFGRNLLKVTKSSKGTDIKTALIPLGKAIGNERITIEDVNDGKNYLVNEEAAKLYGLIWGTAFFDDVEDENELLAKGKETLTEVSKPKHTIQATAVDMSLLDRSIDEFKIGYKVPMLSKPHGIDDTFQVTEITRPLFEPDKFEVTLGGETDKISGTVVSGQVEAKQYTNEKVSIISGGSGGYLILDPPGDRPERLLIMDDPNKDKAVNVIQINKNGIGFSRNGINGPYENAWTIDGNLVADFIRAAKLQAGTVGGWAINDEAMYSDYFAGDGSIYRVYIQKFLESSLTDSWVFSIQKSEDAGKTFNGIMYIRGDGKIVAPSADIGRFDALNVLGSVTTGGNFVANGSDVSIFSRGITCGGNTAYPNTVASIMGNGIVERDFSVYGTFYAAKGSIASSDRALKANIEDLDSMKSEEFLMRLKPVEYVYKDDPDTTRHGFVAQDVKEAMAGRTWGVYENVELKQPLDAKGKSQKSKVVASVRYDEIIADLVKVVQDQHMRIETLESEVKALGKD